MAEQSERARRKTMEERNQGVNEETVRGAVELKMMDVRRDEGERSNRGLTVDPV